jgi:hypothetical protein
VWTIVESNGELTGTMKVNKSTLAGTLHGSRKGDELEFVVDFTFPEKNCGGKLESKGSAANNARFFEGTLVVKSNCSDHDEPGTWIMRRYISLRE